MARLIQDLKNIIYPAFFYNQPNLPLINDRNTQKVQAQCDLHLIRNAAGTLDLRKHIYFLFNDNVSFKLSDLLALPTTDPNFLSDFDKINCYSEFASTILTNDGITLNTTTGEITATAPATYKLSNFKMTLEFYQKVNNTSVLMPNYSRMFFVHLHPSISKVWLTPDSLDIYIGTTSRFHLLAEFSDAIVGNITNNPGIIWTCQSADISILADQNLDTQLIQLAGHIFVTNEAGAIAAGAQWIKAQMPAYLTVNAGTALVTSGSNKVTTQAKPSATNQVNVSPIPLSEGHASNAEIAEYQNLLFIPDGFDSSQMAEFERIVNGVVAEIKSNTSSSPWNIIPLNFWKLNKSSVESGASYYFEVLLLDTVDLTENPNSTAAYPVAQRAWPLPRFLAMADSFVTYGKTLNIQNFCKANPTATTPVTVPIPAANYTVSELTYTVGPPTAKDKSKTQAVLLAEWASLYGLDITKVSDVVFKLWLLLAERTFLNQKNTFVGAHFGIQGIGSFSNMFYEIENQLTIEFSFSPICERMSRAELNNRLSFVNAPSNSSLSLGQIWSITNPPTYPESGIGKDFRNIVVISNSSTDGGFNRQVMLNGWTHLYTTSMAVSMAALRYVIPYTLVATGSKEAELDLTAQLPINATSIRSAAKTIIHELSHAYALGDEYGGGMDFTNISAAEIARLNTFFNLQHTTSLEVGGSIVGDNIKWRWPRITAAGVTTALLSGSGNSYSLQLKPGHGKYFKPGDNVYLRKELLYQTASPVLGLPAGEYSPQFTISGTITNDILPLTLTGTAPPTLISDFQPSSKVLKLQEDFSLTGAFKSLVSNVIRLHINTSHLALTGACSTSTNDTDIQKPTNLPAQLLNPLTPSGDETVLAIWRKMFAYKYVGLYAGGENLDCNVYHPTGLCIMRNVKLSIPIEEKAANGNVISQSEAVTEFCPVCKYAIIDKIAPHLHSEIEKEFASQYFWLEYIL